jgi:protein ImuB
MKTYLSIFFPHWSSDLVALLNGKPAPVRFDEQMLLATARWALRFTPLVSLAEKPAEKTDNPDLQWGILLDLTGTERLHGERHGERHGEGHHDEGSNAEDSGFKEILALKIMHALSVRHKSVRLGFAETPALAWAAARFGSTNPYFIHSYQDATFTQLPIEALNLPAAITTHLHELSIRTIDQLLKLPKEKLLTRYGKEISRRLDQIEGTSAPALTSIHESHPIAIQHRFEFPLLQKEAAQKAAALLLNELFKKLDRLGLVAGQLLLRFTLLHSDKSLMSIDKQIGLNRRRGTPEPVIAAVVDSLKLGGALQRIYIEARDVVSRLSLQPSFLGDDTTDIEEHAKNLRTLIGIRLGEDRICKTHFESSYIPERAFSITPLKATRSATTVVAFAVARPSLLLAKPQPINAIALLPDKPPSQIQWEGRRIQIRHGIGPEKISGEWWRSDKESDRDYFKIQDESGRWLWIYRTLRNQTFHWFVHGIWA